MDFKKTIISTAIVGAFLFKSATICSQDFIEGEDDFDKVSEEQSIGWGWGWSAKANYSPQYYDTTTTSTEIEDSSPSKKAPITCASQQSSIQCSDMKVYSTVGAVTKKSKSSPNFCPSKKVSPAVCRQRRRHAVSTGCITSSYSSFLSNIVYNAYLGYYPACDSFQRHILSFCQCNDDLL